MCPTWPCDLHLMPLSDSPRLSLTIDAQQQSSHMQHALFSRRFEELSKSLAELQFHPNSGGLSGSNVRTGDWMRWATSAQSLVRAVYGEDTPHYQNLVKAIASCSGYDDDVMTLRGIFLSAKDDFDGGYVFNADLRVSGEVFGDFVTLAKQ